MIGSVRFLTFGYSDHLFLAGLHSGMVPDPFGGFEASLLQSGSTVQFEGAFGVGSSGRVERLIAQNDGISAVILQSPGGWAYEGLAMHRVLSNASVSTYVIGECSSVCAIAFAAGKRRYITQGGKIGVHRFRGVTRGFDPAEWQHEAARSLSEQSIEAAFIEEMFAVPPDRLWYPSGQRLIDANFVTDIVSCADLPPILAAACRDQPASR